jgi:glyoxylase-like metal-dependent hydrolase (beta-lactamase superfamily II)
VITEKLADGVYRITGGYVALAVEFKDHIVVIECGQSEARGQAVLAEARKAIPGKPIRYVVNTHAHFDHAGGLAPVVAEGIAIITQQDNKAPLERLLSAPRTLAGDALAKSGRRPKIEAVREKRVLSDGTRTLELHHIQNLAHSDGMLVAYLPKERILMSADFNIPAPGQPANASLLTLLDNIDRLQIDFDRHVTVHPLTPDRLLSRAELAAFR